MSRRRVPVDTFGIKGARIWPKKSTIPVGYKFVSKWGRTWEVVENCGGSKYKILADDVTVIRDMKEIRSGQVLHPCDKTVYGRGYLGIGEHTFQENKHRSDCWRAMIKRCYIATGDYPTYSDVEVCEEWENFQLFATWYDVNYVAGWDLDKDLKDLNNESIYSPKTCCFIPPKLNKQLSHRYESVPTKEGRKYRSQISFDGKRLELGRFTTWENALCLQIQTRFSILQSEIEKVFGSDFTKIFWNEQRLCRLLREGVENVRNTI